MTSVILTACVQAINDAGVDKADIDGICGSFAVSDVELQLALGLPEVRWGLNQRIPFGFQVIEAMNAVYAGACDVALIYHGTYHGPRSRDDGQLWHRSAAVSSGSVVPWRTVGRQELVTEAGTLQGGIGYASWASRYLTEFGVSRAETLGLIAVNNRTNAAANDNAILRSPITLSDYEAARMIREPFGLLDMDIPVTGADAFIVTTKERARDLKQIPVLIHSATAGRTGRCREDQLTDLRHTGQEIVSEALWAKSELHLEDVDVVLAYDGFTLINLLWLESIGYCQRGEAASFLSDHWSQERSRIEIGRRVPVNTHGGNLSEGATQGSGALVEAVRQLRGTAGSRQVDQAEIALWLAGGIVWNASGAVLRADSNWKGQE